MGARNLIEKNSEYEIKHSRTTSEHLKTDSNDYHSHPREVITSPVLPQSKITRGQPKRSKTQSKRDRQGGTFKEGQLEFNRVLSRLPGLEGNNLVGPVESYILPPRPDWSKTLGEFGECLFEDHQLS